MKTIGFIGCGNMGGALARAVCRVAAPEDVVLANRTPAKAEALAAELGCRTGTNEDAAGCDLVFLGVKPQMMAGMLAPLQAVFAARAAKGERFVLCTMAAGLTMAQIRQMAGGDYPVIRVNPNIPSAVGEGMVPYCTLGITGAEEADFRRVPAWACQFIEALADGGVACGLPRAKAQQYAAQMVLGTARMLLENGGHPGALKDAVCSPGGTTIQGVRVLEERGFRGAAMDAVIAAYEKTCKLREG